MGKLIMMVLSFAFVCCGVRAGGDGRGGIGGGGGMIVGWTVGGNY